MSASKLCVYPYVVSDYKLTSAIGKTIPPPARTPSRSQIKVPKSLCPIFFLLQQCLQAIIRVSEQIFHLDICSNPSLSHLKRGFFACSRSSQIELYNNGAPYLTGLQCFSRMKVLTYTASCSHNVGVMYQMQKPSSR